MAELVGLVASVATLVAGADYVRQLLTDVKNGANERQQLLTSITSLRTILDDLRTSWFTRQANGMGEEWANLVKPLETRGVFQRIEDLFSEIRLKLDPKHRFNRLIAQISWPFVKEDVERNIRQMRDLSRDVSLVLQDVSLKLAIVTYGRVTNIDLRESRREQQAILDWFSTMRFIEQQEIESRRATAGTCDWFFSLSTYQTWKYQQNRILYCKAIGGAGKTILASKTYEDLRSFTAGQNCGVFIVHFKYDQPDTHVPLKIVGALLRQSIQLQDGRMDDSLEKFLDEYYYRESAKPDIDVYMTQLRTSLKQFSSIFLVVDGLDEIKSDASRISMINLIEAIREDTSILFTSRPVSIIDDAFDEISVPPGAPASSIATLINDFWCSECGEGLATRHRTCSNCDLLFCQKCVINDTRCDSGKAYHEFGDKLFVTALDVSARSSAIRTYVRARIERSPHLGKWIERRPGLSKQIEDKVVDMAQKMFLLAQLHMDAITDPDLLKESDFDRALQGLPKELDNSYDQAMKRVDSYGRSLIQVITYADRWLTAAEIEHALGIDVEDGTLRDGDIIPVTALISRCAGLVTFNAKDCVTFAHYTISEYFSATMTKWFPDGHVDLFHRCLSYLQLPAFSRGAELSKVEGKAYTTRLAEFPFLDYASVHWAEHLQATNDNDLFQRGLDLVTNPSIFSSIVQALWYSKDVAAVSWRKRANASPLEFAIFSKFPWLFDQLLASGVPMIGSDKLKMTPLMLTAKAGELEMTKRVLEMGCDVNAVNAENDSALHLAIANWNDEVAVLLVRHPETDVNLVTGSGPWLQTPLVLAILQERVAVYTEILSCARVDPNIPLRGNVTALHHAVEEGDEEALRALLSHDKVELHNFPGCAHVPLHTAAESGFVEAIQLLLDAGTDANVRDTGHNATALMRAADYGNVEVIEKLLKHHADPEAIDCYNRHAVHSAAINSQAGAADYLLTHTKININHQDVHGNSPLHDAASHEDFETVEILLKHGARTDLVNNQSHTPLDVARHAQVPKEIIVLLASNTSIVHDHKALDNILDTSQFGDADDIQRTLSDANDTLKLALKQRDSWLDRTPLHHIVQRGFVDLVSVLHRAGSDLNAQDKYGRTALHIAAVHGRTGVAQYLLENGVETETKDIWGVTPLQEAYMMSKPWTAVLLVEHGVELRRDVDIQWLLNQATWQGNLKATKRLIEAGARVDYKLKNGMTLYEYAKDQGHNELADYLDSADRDQTETPIEPPTGVETVRHETDQVPDIKVLKDGKIKRLRRTGTDEVDIDSSYQVSDKKIDAKHKELVMKQITPNSAHLLIFTIVQLVFVTMLAVWWWWTGRQNWEGVHLGSASKDMV